MKVRKSCVRNVYDVSLVGSYDDIVVEIEHGESPNLKRTKLRLEPGMVPYFVRALTDGVRQQATRASDLLLATMNATKGGAS